MSNQAITVNIPDDLYTRLKQRAEQTHRSIEAELLETVARDLPGEDIILSSKSSNELDTMVNWSDKNLWKAARSHISAKAVAKLEALHHKQHTKPLIEAEIQTKDELLNQYNRYMLVRARAAVLLKQRGYDVSTLAN